jgi:hypothetical protein
MVIEVFKDALLEYLAYGRRESIFVADNSRLTMDMTFMELLSCKDPMPQWACVQMGLPEGASYSDARLLLTGTPPSVLSR